MSYVVQGYKNTSAPNKMIKNLSALETYNGVLKDPSNVLNPVITIQTSTFPKQLNYVYIEMYGRYYFITDIVCEINGLFTIHCQVDPLTTWRTALSHKKAVIARQENQYDNYLPDADFKVEQRTRTQCLKFPYTFPRNPIYVLTTV